MSVNQIHRVVVKQHVLIYFYMGLVQMSDNNEELSSQSLTMHLAELRSCFIISFAAIMAGFAGAYSVIRPIADWFFCPLVRVLPEGKTLIFTSYQEGFFFT